MRRVLVGFCCTTAMLAGGCVDEGDIRDKDVARTQMAMTMQNRVQVEFERPELELHLDEVDDAVQSGLFVGTVDFDLNQAAALGRETGETHDALGVGGATVIADRDLREEGLGQFDDAPRSPEVEPNGIGDLGVGSSQTSCPSRIRRSGVSSRIRRL